MSEILRVTKAACVGGHRLSLKFNDGSSKVVDVRGLLKGPVFQPLMDEGFFARGKLDRVCGTVVWPNGADIDSTVLYGLYEPAWATHGVSRQD